MGSTIICRACVKNSVHGGGVSRPTPWRKLGGLARGVSRPPSGGILGGLARGVSRPTPGGDVGGSGWGCVCPGLNPGEGVQAHTCRGGGLSRPRPGVAVSQYALRQTPPTPADGYCCGRYASYWNAFLFSIIFELIVLVIHLCLQIYFLIDHSCKTTIRNV